MNQDISVCIETSWATGEITPVPSRARDVCSTAGSTVSLTQLYAVGTNRDFIGLKWPNLEANYSAPPAAEIKEFLEQHLHITFCVDGAVLN